MTNWHNDKYFINRRLFRHENAVVKDTTGDPLILYPVSELSPLFTQVVNNRIFSDVRCEQEDAATKTWTTLAENSISILQIRFYCNERISGMINRHPLPTFARSSARTHTHNRAHTNTHTHTHTNTHTPTLETRQRRGYLICPSPKQPESVVGEQGVGSRCGGWFQRGLDGWPRSPRHGRTRAAPPCCLKISL